MVLPRTWVTGHACAERGWRAAQRHLHSTFCHAFNVTVCVCVCVCVVALWQAGGVLTRWQYRVSRSRVCWRVLSVCWTGARRPPPALGTSGSEEGLVAFRVSNISDPLFISLAFISDIADRPSPCWHCSGCPVSSMDNRSGITSFPRLLVCLSIWRGESCRHALYVIVCFWGEMFYPRALHWVCSLPFICSLPIIWLRMAFRRWVRGLIWIRRERVNLVKKIGSSYP